MYQELLPQTGNTHLLFFELNRPCFFDIFDKERYLWAVARYIEKKPVRAKIVKRVEDYPYSSGSAYIKGAKDEILTEELFKEGQRKDYVE